MSGFAFLAVATFVFCPVCVVLCAANWTRAGLFFLALQILFMTVGVIKMEREIRR